MIALEIEKKLNDVVQLLEKHHIEIAFLFGSSIRNDFNDHSDIDILVRIQDNLSPEDKGTHLWNLIYDLEELFDRKVDLLTETSLKNPYLIAELDRTKLKIYEKIVA